MVLAALPERVRWLVEFWALAFAACAAGWLTWRIALLVQDSWRFNELSIGMLPIPLAIPQLAMTIGAAILTIAVIDELVLVAQNGRPSFRASEDTPAPAKEA
jgi:TRAP-type C4-dicarboxylate transport system permease small subunit